MMRRGLFKLWTSRSCTTTTTTSEAPFMEDYSSEDYDDDDNDMVPSSNDPIIIECNEETAPEVPNVAVGTEETKDGEAFIASLPLSIPTVKTSWDSATVQAPTPFHDQCPEYLSMEMFMSSAALFVLQECRSTIKSWIERFFSQLGLLGIRFYSALRTLIRKPFVWASRRKRN